MTEAWVDDLEIGPVIDGPGRRRRHGGKADAGTDDVPLERRRRTGVTPVPPPSEPPKSTRVAVEFNREQLYVGGRNLMFRGVRYSDTPLKVLRDAGLNTLFVGDRLDPAVYDEAIREGLLARADAAGRHARTRRRSPAT